MSVSAPREPEAPTTDEAARPPAPLHECPRCGTPYEPGREYCLECGLRLPAAPRGVVPRLSHGWRRRVGWYPGDWIWPSLLALVIAALAGLGAAAFVSHDRKTTYVTGTSPVGPATSTLTPPEHSTSTPTTGAAKRKRRQQPAPVKSLKTWPAGESGWTVVLQSLPATNGRAFALAQARAALHGGVPDVGILESSQYSSLHPGYYVLFSGVFSSLDDANSGVTAARSHGYPRAYARRITP